MSAILDSTDGRSKPLLARLMAAHHIWSWADQAVVSAASFVMLVMLARATDAAQLGAYAVGVSVFALLLATQESLITRPYAIQLYRPIGTPSQHAFSTFALSLLLSLAAVPVLVVTGLGLQRWGLSNFAQVAFALAAALPSVLIREFARRYAFAHLRMFQAMLLDCLVAAITLVLLGWLAWRGELLAHTAFLATGAACGIGGVTWFILQRREFTFSLSHLGATFRQSWSQGRWLFSGQLAIQAQGYMTHWLSLVIAGVTVTGIYAACMSIVAFSNPILYGVFNVLTPKSVRMLRNNGPAALKRQVMRDAALLAMLMIPFCATIYLAGDTIMALVFKGAEYAGHGNILTVLALSALASAVGAPASIALASAERSGAVAVVTSLTALLNILLVWWFLTQWGLLGAAYAVLLVEILGCLGRWTAFLMLVPTLNATKDA